MVGTRVALNVQWPSLEPLPLGQDYHDDSQTFISNINIDIQYIGPYSETGYGAELQKSIKPRNPDDPRRFENPDDNLDLRIKGNSVYGLTPYYADFDLIETYYKRLYGGRTRAVDLDIHKDWYIRMNGDDLPSAVIICDNMHMPDGVTIEKERLIDAHGDYRSICTHQFIIPEYHVFVYVDYLRVMMRDWQRIEAHIRTLLKESEVK